MAVFPRTTFTSLRLTGPNLVTYEAAYADICKRELARANIHAKASSEVPDCWDGPGEWVTATVGVLEDIVLRRGSMAWCTQPMSPLPKGAVVYSWELCDLTDWEQNALGYCPGDISSSPCPDGQVTYFIYSEQALAFFARVYRKFLEMQKE